ncbi:MAG: PAS domain-containing protein, partial [Anaerolineae bacterium]|nr:PAS domain-containing protein [Anaerolineae bacterium]
MMTNSADLQLNDLKPADLELLLRQSMSYGKDMARVFSLEKERREQLELANQLLQETFSSVPVGLVILDHLFRVVGANSAFCKLLGDHSSEAELIGSTIGAVLGEHSLGLVTLLTTMQNAGTEVEAEEAQIRVGTTPVQVRVAMLRSGQSRGWVLTCYVLDTHDEMSAAPASEDQGTMAQLEQMRQELDNTTRQSLVYARDMRAMFQRLKDANA